MVSSRILRGDIYMCDFGASEDHTMAKERPVIIIQNNLANRVSEVVIISPITSSERVRQLPVGVELNPGPTGLDHVSFAHLGHIYTVDKGDLLNRIGAATPTEMQEIDYAIKVSLGLQ